MAFPAQTNTAQIFANDQGCAIDAIVLPRISTEGGIEIPQIRNTILIVDDSPEHLALVSLCCVMQAFTYSRQEMRLRAY